MCSLQAQAAANRFMTVGEHSYGQPLILRTWRGLNCCIEETKLKIGKFCSLADGIEVFMGGNHRSDWITTFPMSCIGVPVPLVSGNHGDIVIGSDVWIGSQATIMSGVTIGDGAVIGAKAVVASSVPPYAVVVGNPARVIKKRFSDEVIAGLLEIKWWDWPIDKIRRAGSILSSPDYKALLEFKEKNK